MARIYGFDDVDLALLRQKAIGVLGYGSQGRAQARNLRDGGHDVSIGVREGESYARAEEDGFRPTSVAECVAQSDVVALCLPDASMPEIYSREIEPNLSSGQCLIFAHGYNVRFGLIAPPDFVDVGLAAPSAPGAGLRTAFESGSGTPGLVAVDRDASGQCLRIAVAYGWEIGCRQGMIETTFAEETETDLFAEQVVLCGGLPILIRSAFETLVAAGYQPEVAYSCCLHEVKLIVDLIVAKGLSGMRRSISDTAAFGGLIVGPDVIGTESRSAMRAALAQIRSGEFAQRLANPSTPVRFEELRAEEQGSGIERVGAELRNRFFPKP